jgi:hypothetical protein
MSTDPPKVFVSYSWVIGDKVLELAEPLRRDGIDIKLDKTPSQEPY